MPTKDINGSIGICSFLDLVGGEAQMRVEFTRNKARIRLLVIGEDWRNLNSIYIKLLDKQALKIVIDKFQEIFKEMEE